MDPHYHHNKSFAKVKIYLRPNCLKDCIGVVSLHKDTFSLNYIERRMYASVNRVNIGSDNGLSHTRHKAII